MWHTLPPARAAPQRQPRRSAAPAEAEPRRSAAPAEAEPRRSAASRPLARAVPASAGRGRRRWRRRAGVRVPLADFGLVDGVVGRGSVLALAGREVPLGVLEIVAVRLQLGGEAGLVVRAQGGVRGAGV